MKPTGDGKWAHLVCALWIPEVSIRDAILMEPIDGVENIGRDRASLVSNSFE
jgi:NuA3 HAT complex component NTO1